MAVIKAVSSKAGIGHAIDYVTKKEKTGEACSGSHCEPETVKEEMQATKKLWIRRTEEPISIMCNPIMRSRK